MPYESWGRLPRATPDRVHAMRWADEPLPTDVPLLAYGLGRSYGDVCLNDGGTVLDTRSLRRLITFDAETGILRCEAGTSLDEILTFAVPRGFFLPVTPGTRFVTVGGAIANDVHGKNHHVAGTFGRHVLRLALRRSDGSVHDLSPTDPLFAATVGGLGLTGLVLWADIRLQPIASAQIDGETVRFRSLDGFFDASEASDAWPYTVAWIDTTASGAKLGRGLFMRGRHAPADGPDALRVPDGLRLAAPFDAPNALLRPLTVRAFNTLYYGRVRHDLTRARVPYTPFFYPLDAVAHWNRMYGKRGFFQHQFVVPHAHARTIVRDVLARVAQRGDASFLAVLKAFGDLPSPGMLSFPRPGVTLALDFAHQGERTLRLLDDLDRMVMEAGGAIYPAKDARMAPATFRASFPSLDAFRPHLDPAFSSSFWRRMET